jgi:hypothetical protein
MPFLDWVDKSQAIAESMESDPIDSIENIYTPTYAIKIGGRYETAISGVSNFAPIDSYSINFIPYDQLNKK